MTHLLRSLRSLHFVEVNLLFLTLLIPVSLWIARRREAPRILFGPASFADTPPLRSWRSALQQLPTSFQVIAIGLAIVALARPIQRVELPRRSSGIDIVLCIDLSSSMGARDMDATRTRLDIVKDAAIDFIRKRKDDRIGMVSFARFPDLRCPLTRDHEALIEILRSTRLVEHEGPEDATGIGAALARCAQLLQSSGAPSKEVIFLSDGVENVATIHTPSEIAPLHAAQLCETASIRVHMIVAGRGEIDADGTRLPPDTRQARRVARKTGGRFFQVAERESMAAVYGDIDRLQTTVFEAPRFEMRECYLPFLLAALSFAVLGSLLSMSRLGVLP